MKKIILSMVAFCLILLFMWPVACGKKSPTGGDNATATLTPTATFTSTPSSTPTVCSQTGDLTTPASSVTKGLNWIYAYPVTLATAKNATAVAVYISDSAATGNLVVGLYDSSAGAPNNLLESGVMSCASSNWNELTFPSLALSAGTYWVAFINQNSVWVGPDAATSVLYYYQAFTYNDTLPSSFGSASNTPGNHPVPYYLKTCP